MSNPSKTIAVMTYYNNGSYGAALQAFALQNSLMQLGMDAYVIRYAMQYPLKTGVCNLFHSRSIHSLRLKLLDRWQRRQTEKFADANLRQSAIQYRNLDELQRDPPQADFYVCGSDQIWNTWRFNEKRGVDGAFFLNFGQNETQRIAYAASFGTAVLPEAFKQLTAPLLRQFNRISVRESASVPLVEEMCGKQPVVAADPTLLLSAADYLPIMNSGGVNGSASTLPFTIYMLGSAPSLYEPIIKELQGITGHRGLFMFGFSDEKLGARNTRPSIPEWLSSIQRSEFILTDSFHGTVFAIIFQRPFIVLQRDGGVNGRTVRIIHLLKALGLEARLVAKNDPQLIRALFNATIDWDGVNRRICEMRSSSIGFVRDAINSRI